MTHAIYPGSFDPLHNGHADIIRRASAMFDRLTVAVLDNPLKDNKLFSIDERLAIIESVVADLGNTEAKRFEGLLVEYVEAIDADVIVKSLRSVYDFDYELQMAHMNRHMLPQVETVFLVTDPRWSFVSSTRVREVSSYGADASDLVPEASFEALKRKFADARR